MFLKHLADPGPDEMLFNSWRSIFDCLGFEVIHRFGVIGRRRLGQVVVNLIFVHIRSLLPAGRGMPEMSMQSAACVCSIEFYRQSDWKKTVAFDF
jgi:hypothetical protein